MRVSNNAARMGTPAVASSSTGSQLAVGRVGALAVALGLGAAVLAMPGLAAADTEGSGGASGASTTSGSDTARRGAHHPGRAAATRSSASDGAQASDKPAERRSGAAERKVPALSDAAGPEAALPADTPRSAAVTRVTRPEMNTPSVQTVSASVSETATAGNAGSTATVTSGSLPTAAANATPAATPKSVLQGIVAENQVPVRTIFHTLMNWVSTLPVNPITNWLEGGLLMVRKSFFNQTAAVSAVQTVNSSHLVTGKIDVTDPEGDGWNIEVVTPPTHGTVVLGTTSQANGIGSTRYTYSPTEGYTGDDQFVVKVTPTDPTFNIADPFGVLNSRYYTVVVGNGAEAGKTCFNCLGSDLKDTFDTHLYLRNAGATVTVKKEGFLLPQYIATVTLSASAATRAFDWMDTRGRKGTISVDQMLTEDWSAFEDKASTNATKPLLAFNYIDQGVDKSVFVDVSTVTKNADGTYQFTGKLMEDTPAQDGRVDNWDFLGINYKRAYENYLNASGLADCKSGQVCSSTTAVGILGATTLSANAFREAGGHDYALPTPDNASATQTTPGSMGPGSVGTNQGNGAVVQGNTGDAAINQTAMIPWGNDGSFITASNLTQGSAEDSPNGIFMYTANGPANSQPTWTSTQLQNNGWDAAVNVMLRYDQIATDASGNPIPATFTGVVGTNDLLKASLPTGVTVSNMIGQAVSGEGIAANTVITGFVSTQGGTSTFTVSNPISTATDYIIVEFLYEATISATYAGTASNTNLITLTVPDGFVAEELIGQKITGDGIAAGTVITSYESTGSGGNTYTATASNSISSATSTIAVNASYGGIFGGDYAGTIGSNSLLTLSIPNNVDPASLIGQTITGDGIPVNTIINGFEALGSGTNVIYTVSNPITSATSTISVATPNLPKLQTGLVVGLSDGSVQYWNGSTGYSTQAGDTDGWVQLQASNAAGWGQDVAVQTLVSLPDNQGFAVGLSNGAVYVWNNTILADETFAPGPGSGTGCSNSNAGACWKQLQGPGWDSPVNTMIASGQGGGVVVGLADGSVQQYDATLGAFVQLQNEGWSSAINTMLPYDGTTLVGSISGSPVVVSTTGDISAPSYASLLTSDEALAASTADCGSNYGGGSGAGCSGYVLTVQQAAGNTIRVGQTLYGGAGLTAGTTILQQISDGSGNLCSSSCNAGGTGVYLVNNSQLVAPGTPMSASDGTGFIVGLADGAVMQYNNGFTQLVDDGWGSGVNTMIAWRDGFVVGLNNGATFYWSPSNNPQGTNGSNANALTYAGSTVTSQNDQGYIWSQLQGVGWDNAATAMTQLGDGFVLGLTASDSSVNGGIEFFNGFGPASSNAAFGYQSSANGPVALTPTYGWYEIAHETSLPSGDNSSIQLMFLVNQYSTDTSGNVALTQSMVASQTNNGIYAWNSTNASPSTATWTTIQEPGTGALDAAMLQAGWNYGLTANTTWGSSGGVGATYIAGTNGSAATGDPVFGLEANQAWCGTNCSGDYVPFTFSYPFGNDGVIWSTGTTLEAEINLASMGYGYIYVPGGIFDKFDPDKYSVAALLAVQGGPSLVLNPPDGGTVSVNDSFTGPHYTYSDVTEVGTFSVEVGVNASISGQMALNSTAPTGPLTLASATYTPGLLYTWNTGGNPDAMGITFAAYPTVEYLTTAEATAYFDSMNPTITATAGVSPFVQVSYGLETPGWFPISIDIFSLTVGYENPVTATATIPVENPSQTTVSLNSQGIIYADAGFLPSITSLLTWSDQYQVYNVTDQLFPS